MIRRCGQAILVFGAFFHCVLWTNPALADILTLDNGERREGIVTSAPAEPDFVMFEDSSGQVKIARSRIRAIENEPTEKDLMHIGDQFYLKKRYDLSMEAYKKAGAAAPENQEVADRMARAAAALESTASAARTEQIAQVDKLLNEAVEASKGENFQKAEDLLYRQIPELSPSATQQERLRTEKIGLKKRWGKERLDKLAKEAAAAHFEEVLRLDPGDAEAFTALLSIWAEMPEKTEQVIAAYEARLQADPDDKVNRKSLADKYYAKGEYAKAVEHYEILFRSGDFKNSQISANLVSSLKVLYQDAEKRRDYDAAIGYYKKLQTHSKEYDDTRLRRLEFWKEWEKTGPEDVDRRTSLTLWARSQGLDQLALEKLNEMRGQYPGNETILKTLRLYADEILAKASASLQAGRYTDAFSQATQANRDYGYFPDVKEESARIIGLANQEMLRARRQGRELAMDYKRQADMYMGMGEGRLESLRSQEINRSVRIVSDKQLAIENFRMAIQYYQEALRAWPQMDAPTRQEIQINLRRAQQYQGILTSGRAIRLPDTSRSLGR